ncbi:ring finger domain-containing protein [Ditylenchus destructor]|nr:ring finger domain-containing protein [Ditylenchus destructor]
MSGNRRKGNAQTASSSKALELLQNSGISIPFFGVEDIPIQKTASEDGLTLDESFLNVAPEIRIIFKKLSKKDPQTREKAIKDLDAYTKTVASNDLKSVFNYFASIYSKLVTDSTPSIRSLSNSLLATFLKTLRKDAPASNMKLTLPFLLFSLSDKSETVSKSAEKVLDECFTEEKRLVLLKNFSKMAVNISIDVVNLKHKIVLPQQSVDEETDAQRQTRLIAQALLNAARMLEGADNEVADFLCDHFVRSNAISMLMQMQVNVKAETFGLLSKLLQYKPASAFGTKIPSIILNHLDSEHVALCRNAFECFLTLASDVRFYESCKIDKAVIPKLLSIVRKKSLHWSVLKTSLLPAFVLVCQNLPVENIHRWITSLLESFFEGDIQLISTDWWSASFCEVCRYSLAHFSNNSETAAFILAQIQKFVDIILQVSKDETILRQAAILICAVKFEEEAKSDLVNSFRKDIGRNFYLDHPTQSSLVQAIQKYPDVCCTVDGFSHVISQKMRYGDDESSRLKLLAMLCNFLAEGKVGRNLNDYVPLCVSWFCNALVQLPEDLTTKLLSSNDKMNIALTLLTVHCSSPEEFTERETTAHISWTLHNLTSIDEVDLILDATFQTDFISYSMKIIEKYAENGKISKQMERQISLKLFEQYLNGEYLRKDTLRGLMRLLEVEIPKAKVLLEEFLDSRVTNFSRVNSIQPFAFANASVESFLPDVDNFRNLLFDLDQKLTFRMLAEDDVSLLSQFSKDVSTNEELFSEDAAFKYILILVKKALVYHRLAVTINKGPIFTSSMSFVWIVTVFAKLLQRQTFSLDKSNVLLEFIATVDNEMSPTSDSIVEAVDLISELPNKILPISFIFAIRKTVKEKNLALSSSEFRECFESGQSAILRLNIDSTDAIPSAISDSAESSTNVSKKETNDATILSWIYELERAYALVCEKNQIEAAVVSLTLFVERKTIVDEWLFTFQRNRLKDSLSCAMLRLCCKVIPYIAELQPEIRDFINCAFITALQTCSDYLPRTTPSKEPLLYLLATLCFRMHEAYEYCMQLNTDNASYYDVKQEWKEFFGPSSVNFIISWFVAISGECKYAEHSLFVLKLCRSIHCINLEMIPKVEILKLENLQEMAMFERYPSNLANMLGRASILLSSPVPEVQLASAKIFRSALLDMFSIENQTVLAEDDTMTENVSELKPEQHRKLPAFFQSLLERDFRVYLKAKSDIFGDNDDLTTNDQTISTCTVDPPLQAWDVLIRFLAELDVQTRVQYCDALSPKLVSNAMNLLFSQLPESPKSEKAFLNSPDYHRLSVFDNDNFVCNLYYRSLIVIPAFVRQWYKSLSKKGAGLVDRYTRKFVSPLVLQREIQNVTNIRRGRLEVKVMPNVNEVSAFYKMEDTTIRLNISLSANYPLSLATIEIERSIVSKDLHRRWLLQLEMFLSHQNGPLLDGILQWKRNIDKHLEGVEDCTICMMTVSSTNYQLPKIRCRQCKKKFHGDCLYKWFQTSANSSCPLCRSNFSHTVNAISRRRIQEMPNRASLKPASRFRAAHASFRLRMLQEQHAPATEPKRLGHRFHAIQSDPSAPATTRDPAPAPLDLTRVLSGSQRKKLSMIKMSTPPQTPTSLSVDTAFETILKKQQIIRTASGGSQNSGLLKKRSSAGDDASSVNLVPSLIPASANNQAEGLSSSSVLYSPVAGTSFGYGMHPHVSPRNSAPSHKSSAVITSENSRKFKMAHESFRIRMFQEQYGFEPVFMTKKRTADSKFSEFKGGDLNKYTAQSYTIKNGNEVFGGWL